MAIETLEKLQPQHQQKLQCDVSIEVDECLQVVCDQEYIIQVNTDRYKFAHDMIRLAAYAMIPQDNQEARPGCPLPPLEFQPALLGQLISLLLILDVGPDLLGI